MIRENWPNLFIVGAMRCGTTSLYEYLCGVDGIYMSPVKEPHHFSGNIVPEDSIFPPILEKSEYLGLFREAKDEKILGEASPTYLQDIKAPELIHEVSPEAKIIVMLRDPIERAYSHYLLLLSKHLTEKSFEDYIKNNITDKGTDFHALINIIEGGMYSNQVYRYLKCFHGNVKVVVFEQFISDTQKGVSNILEFLGVTADINSSSINVVHNAYALPKGEVSRFILSNRMVWQIGVRLLSSSFRSKLRERFLLKKVKKPTMKREDRNLLFGVYEEDVRRLEQILGVVLPWRNFGCVSL